LPYDNARQWPYWLLEHRQELPQEWPPAGTKNRAANGDEYDLRVRLVALDPFEQRITMQARVALWREGQLIAEEERMLQESLYFRNELLLLLAQAGFLEVEVRAGYTEAQATMEHGMLVFVAKK
jgi:hypothetical protein